MKIDSEFKQLIPELAVGEYQKLEASVIKEGCRDSLVVWNGTLLDGHNRYEICTKHNIPFNTVAIELDGRAAAKEWILRNQLGRRNLTPYMLGVLALKLEESIAAQAKARQKTSTGGANPQLTPKSAEPVTPIETRKEVAKLAGIGKTQIEQIKIIEKEATPEQKADLAKGNKKVNTVYRELRPLKVIEGSKICSVCGINKPLTDYYTLHKSQCKECYSFFRGDKTSTKEEIRALSAHVINGVDTILEDMKNIAPPEEGADKEVYNSIISKLVEIVNKFNIEINEFLYADSILKGQVKPKAILEKAVENLQIIIKKMEE